MSENLTPEELEKIVATEEETVVSEETSEDSDELPPPFWDCSQL